MLVHLRQCQRRRFLVRGKAVRDHQETGRKLVVAGPVVGRLTTTNEWRAADDRRFCVDERTVTFYRTKTARIIDFEFRIVASDGPVTFGDTKEGMFGIRVASSMDVTKKTGWQDHQRRRLDRRESLGQTVAVGRLRRSGQGQDRSASP